MAYSTLFIINPSSRLTRDRTVDLKSADKTQVYQVMIIESIKDGWIVLNVPLGKFRFRSFKPSVNTVSFGYFKGMAIFVCSFFYPDFIPWFSQFHCP